MKITKKLLPIATIGSIASIITPIATSCNNAIFYTNDLNFKPSSMHDKTEWEKTSLEIATEYFANPTYFIEDTVFARLNSLWRQYVEKNNDPYISNVKYEVEFKINSISISEVSTKHIKMDDGWEEDVFGANLSMSLTFVLNRQYTETMSPEKLEEGISKNVYTTIEKETFNSKLSNYYAFTYYNKAHEEETGVWPVGLYADKNNDWECHWTETNYLKTINKLTRDGKEYTFVDEKTNKQDVTNSRKIENENYREVLNDIGTNGSYYLTNVVPKEANK